ncbi:MAG: hypothetical protein KDC44_22905 [Phaeodactylibacter sp.]|nr:hypothetical protein [Phaeodactylibacter sp.]
MRRLPLLLPFLCLPLWAAAQHCDCPQNFNWLVQKIELNYPGYGDKVTADTEADLEQHTRHYAGLIQNTQADTTCLRLLREWTAWFKDEHLSIGMELPEESPAQIRAHFAGWERIEQSEAEIRAYLDQAGRHPLEGIWQSNSSNYRVAILQNQTAARDFAATIIQADSVWWLPGQVKFELKSTAADQFEVRYYMKDHSLREDKATLKGLNLALQDLGDWHQVYPQQGQPGPESTSSNTLHSLKSLNDQTVYIRMTTMDASDRKEFKKLIKTHKKLLERTPQLILDLRGNGGGSDITYGPILPYLYTDPVVSDNIQIYLTDDNIDKFAELAGYKDLPWLRRQYYRRYAKKLRKQEGDWYTPGGECQDETTIKHPSPMPQKVAVLIDRGCGSSCEQLVLFADACSRVTLMGQNTGGVLDYANVFNLAFPTGNMDLYYPTTRSCRVADGRGIDNVGIPPDVRIGEEVEDWVEFALEYMRGH